MVTIYYKNMYTLSLHCIGLLVIFMFLQKGEETLSSDNRLEIVLL